MYVSNIFVNILGEFALMWMQQNFTDVIFDAGNDLMSPWQ